MFRFLVRFSSRLWPLRGFYLTISAIGLTLAALEMVPPRIVGNLINKISAPAFEFSEVLRLALIWAGLAVLIQVIHGFQIYLASRCGEKVMARLREDLFANLQQLSMRFYTHNQTGRILSCFGSDLDALRSLATWGLNTITSNAAFLIFSAGLIYYTDAKLFWATVWLAPSITVINFIYGQRISVAWAKVRVRAAQVDANQFENIAGYRVVAAFNRQVQNLAQYNHLQEESMRATVAAFEKGGMFNTLIQWIRFSGRVIIFVYGGHRVVSGDLRIGDLVAVNLYWDWFMMPAMNFGGFFNEILIGMSAAERVFGLLDENPEIKDRPGAQALPPLQGRVEFDRVSFGYLPDREVLHGLSFVVNPGQVVALVGATGSGKTTIMSLLARFYEPNSGSIRLDGHDLRMASSQSLHQQMAIVLQNNYLFTGTILENLRYGKPAAGLDEVVKATRMLGCHDRILRFPEGYETYIGDKGLMLSLGERQLLSFARALVAEPRLLLLDEATSALDPATDALVQKALRSLTRGRTTFIVTHRLSTAENADQILMLSEGRIVEQGHHRELLARKQAYATLYQDSLHSAKSDLRAHEPVLIL